MIKKTQNQLNLIILGAKEKFAEESTSNEKEDITKYLKGNINSIVVDKVINPYVVNVGDWYKNEDLKKDILDKLKYQPADMVGKNPEKRAPIKWDTWLSWLKGRPKKVAFEHKKFKETHEEQYQAKKWSFIESAFVESFQKTINEAQFKVSTRVTEEEINKLTTNLKTECAAAIKTCKDNGNLKLKPKI